MRVHSRPGTDASGWGRSRPSDQLLHGARDKHLPGTGKRPYPRPDVNGDASDVVPDQLDLASVNADSNLEADRADLPADRFSAPHCWPVRRRLPGSRLRRCRPHGPGTAPAAPASTRCFRRGDRSSHDRRALGPDTEPATEKTLGLLEPAPTEVSIVRLIGREMNLLDRVGITANSEYSDYTGESKSRALALRVLRMAGVRQVAKRTGLPQRTVRRVPERWAHESSAVSYVHGNRDRYRDDRARVVGPGDTDERRGTVAAVREGREEVSVRSGSHQEAAQMVFGCRSLSGTARARMKPSVQSGTASNESLLRIFPHLPVGGALSSGRGLASAVSPLRSPADTGHGGRRPREPPPRCERQAARSDVTRAESVRLPGVARSRVVIVGIDTGVVARSVLGEDVAAGAVNEGEAVVPVTVRLVAR
jgi:hypothetical protein